jgi:alpha-galactosidase
MRTFMAVLLLGGAASAWAVSPRPEDFALRSRWVARAKAEPPFSFTYANENSRELLRRWKLTRNAGRWAWRDPRTGLEVALTLTEHADFPAVEWVLHFRNTSGRDTPVIENILSLDAAVLRSAAAPRLKYARGSHNEARDFEPLSRPLPQGESAQFAPYGGRSSDGYLPFFEIAEPRAAGVTLGIGWSGQWAAVFRNRGVRGIQAQAGMERSRFRLRPGEEVRTPAILLQFWQGGGDEYRGQNLWRALLRQHYSPTGPLPAAFSVHGVVPFEKTNEANLLEAVEDIAKRRFGTDTFWIDAGWLTPATKTWDGSMGNIEADPARFPRGLAPIGAAAHRHGMKFLVWFEPERVMPGTWLERNHPEWLIRRPGTKVQLLDLGNPEALGWLMEWASKQIESGGVDIYRQDFNMAPLEFWRAGEADDRQGIREIRHLSGLYSFWDALRRRFPNLLIDNCASGGRRIDFETLRRSVPLWRTDYVWDDLAATQSIAYGLSMWIPKHGLGALKSDSYPFRSGIGPAASFAFDFRSDAEAERARPRIAAYRATQGLYERDYYPLTPYSLGRDVWMAWQFHSPDSGEGLVQAFRREESAASSQSFRLHGLEAQATYELTDQDRPGIVERHTGRQLMGTGLAIELGDRGAAAVVSYRKQ